MPVRIMYGTERRDVYLRAAEDILKHHLVRRVRRPYWGVKMADRGQVVAGVATNYARKGAGVWVRVFGPTDVRFKDRP